MLMVEVRDDPKLPGDSEEVPISEWSGWRLDFHCEIFSLYEPKVVAHIGFMFRIYLESHSKCS